ncbi:MAG TPA: nuclear transport factor 2 family protein [Candidatus Acidoferrales bacterium]|nr:nuclear transport factor 2 family protein [Candidatus Acidoferrales bacterium]
MKSRVLRIALVLPLALMLAGPARIATAGGAAKTRDLAAEVSALKSQIARIALHIRNSEDYIAICNLEDSYGYYVDKARWDEVADLFTRDATLEIGLRGVYKGQDRVRAYLKTLPDLKYGTVFNHSQLQPVVHIDPSGLTAQGRWRAYIQVGQLHGRSQWGEATYENVYAKEDGVWKIKKLHAYFTYYVPYYKGWDQGGDPPPAAIPGFPPDEPPTEVYKLYPDVYIPPYHYMNPVTGK